VWHKESLWTQGLIKVPELSSSIDVWWQQELAGSPKKMRRTKAAIMMYTAWNIWKERNRSIFEHTRADAVQILQEIMAEISVRKLACGGPEFSVVSRC
jgi:hypothetical protein